jgi:hypothetical protein
MVDLKSEVLQLLLASYVVQWFNDQIHACLGKRKSKPTELSTATNFGY